MIISAADFDDPQTIDLLRVHLAGMHANSPPGHVQALDLSGLRSPDISFFAGKDASGQLMGFGALRELSATQAEIKSMRTHPAHLRKGVAAAILTHLLDLARSRCYARVSLETGSGPGFEPATDMYRRFGFAPGAAFGDYDATAFNRFFHLDLRA